MFSYEVEVVTTNIERVSVDAKDDDDLEDTVRTMCLAPSTVDWEISIIKRHQQGKKMTNLAFLNADGSYDTWDKEFDSFYSDYYEHPDYYKVADWQGSEHSDCLEVEEWQESDYSDCSDYYEVEEECQESDYSDYYEVEEVEQIDF